MKATESAATAPLALNLEAIQPGDVLLTHGGDKDSYAIATFDRGAFSHAAIIFNEASTFESDTGIIGQRLLRPLGTAHYEGKRARFAALPGAPVRAGVFRHRAIASVAPETLDAARARMYAEHLGMNYSTFDRLLVLAQLPAALKTCLEPLARWKDRDKDKGVPGAFCSEVVASYYQALGLPLAAQPEALTPNGIVRHAEFLPVEGAVLDASIFEKVEPPTLADPSGGLLTPEADRIGTWRNQQRIFGKALEAVDTTVRESFRLAIAIGWGNLAVTIAQASESLRTAVTLARQRGDVGEIARVLRAAAEYLELRDRTGHCDVEAGPPPDDLRRRWLRHRAANLRLEYLLSAAGSRRAEKHATGPENLPRREQLRQSRREAVPLVRRTVLALYAEASARDELHEVSEELRRRYAAEQAAGAGG